jgi:uncharacterized protein YkwD
MLPDGKSLRAVAGLLAAGSLVAVPAASAHRSHKRHLPRTHRHHGRAWHGCRHADTPATGASAHAMRTAVLCLINGQRAAHGLPGLQGSMRLNRSAQDWTNEMVASGNFTHGSDFSARISAVGFSWSAAGENIAAGFLTPREVVSGWMRSTDHCHNILSPVYRDVGTGVVARGLDGAGAATWTQDFALPRGQSPMSGNWGPANRCPY